MKKALVVVALAAMAMGGVGATAQAGDHEWAVAGKVLAGLFVLDAITSPCRTTVVYQQPVYYTPPVVYQPTVVYQPPVVYTPPVVYAPPVVYSRPVYYYAPRPPCGAGFPVSTGRTWHQPPHRPQPRPVFQPYHGRR